MDLSEQVREFRALQKTHRIRVADFCRERNLDYYEMVEALKMVNIRQNHLKGSRLYSKIRIVASFMIKEKAL